LVARMTLVHQADPGGQYRLISGPLEYGP